MDDVGHGGHGGGVGVGVGVGAGSPNTPTAFCVPTKTLPPAIVGTENTIPSPKFWVLLNSSF